MTIKKTLLHLRILVLAGLPVAAMAATMPGVGNFEEVNDHVYRGAQPTEPGIRNLAKLGVRTVIDLQQPGTRSDEESRWVKAAGMDYVLVPMKGMETPSSASVAKVLGVLENTNTGPVFVHCHRGADRTGGVIACYRIEHDHWTNDRALGEARSMGMSWYQVAIQHFVRDFRPDTATAETAQTIAPVAATALPTP